MSKKASESKQRILSTALDLIKEKGYDSVTINDICTAANISKNTFYYHFKSKEDLMVYFYSIPTVATGNLASILTEESNIEQYWKLMEPMLDFIVSNGTEITKRIFYALINKNILAFEPSKSDQDVLIAEVAIIGRAQAAGEIRNTSDPPFLIAVAQAQLLGVISLWCTTNGKFDFKNAVRLAIEISFDVKPELRKAPPDVLAGMVR